MSVEIASRRRQTNPSPCTKIPTYHSGAIRALRRTVLLTSLTTSTSIQKVGTKTSIKKCNQESWFVNKKLRTRARELIQRAVVKLLNHKFYNIFRCQNLRLRHPYIKLARLIISKSVILADGCWSLTPRLIITRVNDPLISQNYADRERGNRYVFGITF